MLRFNAFVSLRGGKIKKAKATDALLPFLKFKME